MPFSATPTSGRAVSAGTPAVCTASRAGSGTAPSQPGSPARQGHSLVGKVPGGAQQHALVAAASIEARLCSSQTTAIGSALPLHLPACRFSLRPPLQGWTLLPHLPWLAHMQRPCHVLSCTCLRRRATSACPSGTTAPSWAAALRGALTAEGQGDRQQGAAQHCSGRLHLCAGRATLRLVRNSSRRERKCMRGGRAASRELVQPR